MVIEVVTWEGAKKAHAVNQDFPARALCGAWIPERARIDDGWDEDGQHDVFPTCLRCELAVMRS